MMNAHIQNILKEMNFSTLDQAYDYCLERGVDPKKLIDSKERK